MISVERSGSTAVLRMAHGKVNALDVEMCQAIPETLKRVFEDGYRAVVLTAEGPVFSAGVDLFRILDGGPDYADRLLASLSEALLALFRFPLPVVAAVNGHAIAGGAVIACACDYRLAADGPARIGVSELAVGVPYPLSVLEIVRYATGSHAEEVIFTARTYTPAEAQHRGFLHEVVPARGVAEPGHVHRRDAGTGASRRLPGDQARLARSPDRHGGARTALSSTPRFAGCGPRRRPPRPSGATWTGCGPRRKARPDV